MQRSHAHRSSRSLVCALLVVPLVAAGLVVVGSAEPESAAAAFVDRLSEVLEVSPARCGAPFSGLPGSLRCGEVSEGGIFETVEAVAFALAGRGVPLLDLRSRGPIPLYQLVDLPGFGPLPWRDELTRRVYLIDEHRVTVWLGPVDGSGRRPVAFGIEKLDGPFPEIFPALGSASTNTGE